MPISLALPSASSVYSSYSIHSCYGGYACSSRRALLSGDGDFLALCFPALIFLYFLLMSVLGACCITSCSADLANGMVSFGF